jgi:hypothetical protein
MGREEGLRKERVGVRRRRKGRREVVRDRIRIRGGGGK